MWYTIICSFMDSRLLEIAVRGLGKLLVILDLSQAGLQRRPDHREGIAARVKLFRRVRHAGDLDEGLAQLLRVALLRAVVCRPRLLDVALGGVVFDGPAGPSDVPVVQEVRAEEARFDERDLDAELLDLGRYLRFRSFGA